MLIICIYSLLYFYDWIFSSAMLSYIREGNVMQGRAGCGSNWALGNKSFF